MCIRDRAEIGAAGVPQLMVLNKLDLTGLPPTVERDEYGTLLRVRVSARRGDGLSLLREALAEVALAKNRNLRQQSSGEADLQDIDMVFDSDGSA